MIESVPNAVIVNASRVSFTLRSVISSIVYNVQYIMGRPASEQSLSLIHIYQEELNQRDVNAWYFSRQPKEERHIMEK